MAIPEYSVIKVTNAGAPIVDLHNVNLHRITYQLNGPGSSEFSFDVDDPKGKQITRFSEVQIYRGSTLMFWGVVVLIRAERNRVTCQVQGLLWYFHRRFFGKADRTNYLLNPEFESDLANWTATNTTATADTEFKKTKTKSAKLVQSSADQDAFLIQNVTITAGGVGELMTLAGWFRLKSAGYVGPAFEKRGLYLRRVVAGAEHDIAEIDEFDKNDSWQRREVAVVIPPNATEQLDIRVYSPGGVINWDSLSLTKMESTSYYNTDQTVIAGNWITHAQDPAFDKTDLNIGVNTAASGVLIDKHKQHADHENIGSALQEWPALDNGFDYSIVITSTTRTFTTHYPKKGTFKSELELTEGHLIDWIYSDDGERAASSIVVLGDQDGPDREEGSFIDPNGLEGGIVLEDVISAPTDTDIDSLDRYAEEQVRIRKDARNVVLTTSEIKRPLIGLIDVGDTITLNVDIGYTVLDGPWRVITMTIAPHDAETVTLELNAGP